VQLELLDLHIALYNAAGKLPWYFRNHPDSLLQEHPSVHETVLRLRPKEDVEWVTLGESFINTRQCWIEPLNDDKAQLGGEKNKGRWGIFPVLDRINNRHDSARFHWQNSFVSVKFERDPQTNECFAHYGGRRDVLDLALGLGYLDHSTPFAHSAPLQVTVPGLGTLVVEGLTSAPLHVLDPPRVQFTQEGLTLSHLTCNILKPERLRVALLLAVQGAVRRNSGQATVDLPPMAPAFLALKKANQALLADVEAAAGPFQANWPSAELLIKACRRQAELFEMGMADESR
jgi:hypothetical protein